MKLIRKDVDALGIEMSERKIFVMSNGNELETFYDAQDAIMAYDDNDLDDDCPNPYEPTIYVFEATHVVDLEKLRRQGKSDKYIVDKLEEDRRAYANLS